MVAIEYTGNFDRWYAEYVSKNKTSAKKFLKEVLKCKHNKKDDIYYSFREENPSKQFIDSDFNYRIVEIELV